MTKRNPQAANPMSWSHWWDGDGDGNDVRGWRQKKERPESKHWKTLEPNFIHSHPFSSIFRNPKSDMIYHQLFPIFFPKKWQLFLGFHDGSRWWRWFSSQPPITTPWKGRGLGSGTGGRPSELGMEVRAPESRVGKRSVSRSLFMSLNVGKTMPCLPTMTGNGWKTTYKNGDDWGIVFFNETEKTWTMALKNWWFCGMKHDNHGDSPIIWIFWLTSKAYSPIDTAPWLLGHRIMKIKCMDSIIQHYHHHHVF